MSDSDSDECLDPVVKEAAAKRSRTAAYSRASSEKSMEKLLQESKKRKEAIARSDKAAAELHQREARLTAEREASRVVEQATTTPTQHENKPEDVDADEEAALRAAQLFVFTPTVPMVGALELEEQDEPLLKRLNGSEPTDPETAVLLCNGWVQSRFVLGTEQSKQEARRMRAPAALLQWLFRIACFEADLDISRSAASALRAVLKRSYCGERDDEPRRVVRMAPRPARASAAAWVPSPDSFAAALVLYGADVSALAGEDREASRLRELAPKEFGERPSGHRKGAPLDLRRNLLNMLELVEVCAPHWRSTLDELQIRRATRWLWRLLIEPHAAPALVHIQDAIATLISFEVPAGTDGVAMLHHPSAERTMELMRSIGAPLSHASLLRLCQYLPPTPEGNTMQADAAIAAIAMLVQRRPHNKEDLASVDKGGHAVGDKGVVAGVSQLASLVSSEMRAWSFHTPALHSILVLLDVAVSCAAPSTSQTAGKDLRELLRKLGELKSGVQKYKGQCDYYALECESLLAYLQNKFLLLSGIGSNDEDICL